MVSRGDVWSMASANRILSDLRLYGRGYIRNGFGLFFGLVFPVILILLFGAIFSGGLSGSVTIYIQNQDNGQISASFVSALKSMGAVNVISVSTSVNFTQYLSVHSASDGVVIPANFSVDYLLRKPINVTVYGNPSLSSSSIVSGIVSAVINELNLERYGGLPIIGMDQATVNAQATKYVDFLVPGLTGFSILVPPMFSLVHVSSEYKRVKLFKQLSLTPLTKVEWLTSKVLWYVLLGVLSFMLMVAVGVFVFGAHISLTIWLIPFLIIGPMLFASLGMLVGIITESTETASVVGNVITFPMMFLSGTFFPVSLMPQYLQQIAHLLPLFYIIDGLNSVMIYSNYAQAVIDLAVTGVITILIFVAAVKMFKWRED